MMIGSILLITKLTSRRQARLVGQPTTIIGIRKNGVKVFQRRTRHPPGLAIFSVIRLRTPVTQSMFQILEKRHFIITRQMLMIDQRSMLVTAMTVAP